MNMNEDIKTIRDALEEAIAIDKRDNFGDPSLYTHQLENAIAALDRLEVQQRDVAKLVEAGDAMCDELRANDAGNGSSEKGRMEMYQAWHAAKSATHPQQQAKHLTKDDVFFFAEGMERNEWPLLQDVQEELQALSKAWPYLVEHASHIDGAFNIAHGNLRSMISSLIRQRDRAVDAVLTMYEKADSLPTPPQQQPKRLTVDEIERIASDEVVKVIRESGGRFPDYRTGIKTGLRYARDNGYLGGLTVGEFMDVHRQWLDDVDLYGAWDPGAFEDLRARLTAKLSQP